MTCEHSSCSFHVFTRCNNHCLKNVCLKHLMEHEDIFLRDYTHLLDQLDQSTEILNREVNVIMMEMTQRRNTDIEQINRKYHEEQEKIRKELLVAQTANDFFQEKQQQIIDSKEKNQCCLAQHDFEQLKSYRKYLSEQQHLNILPTISSSSSSNKLYSCPLFQSNIFGIKPCHQIRLDCDGLNFNRYNLLKHFEGYHRMLPECALRLRDAICCDQISSNQIELFSENEILRNTNYLIDCPLLNPTNIFGARTYANTLLYIPCTKKQITPSAMINHLTLYHRIKYDLAKRIYQEMKNQTLQSDSILFEEDQRLIGNFRKR